MKSHLQHIEGSNIAMGDEGGCWYFKSPVDGRRLVVIASWGLGWDHVSVSRENRVPNWEEMEWVLNKFAREIEYWVQYHVPPIDHVNFHPFCLHWWRPQVEKLPIPDPAMVGPKT